MGDSGLLAAIAQWVSTVGVPAMVIAWFRLWQKCHELDKKITTLEGLDLGRLGNTVTEIRIIVGELKVRMDMQARMGYPVEHNRREGDR